jgi:hypothetical protein
MADISSPENSTPLSPEFYKSQRQGERNDRYVAKITQSTIPTYAPPATKLSRLEGTHLSATDIETRDVLDKAPIKMQVKPRTWLNSLRRIKP